MIAPKLKRDQPASGVFRLEGVFSEVEKCAFVRWNARTGVYYRARE